MSMDILILVLLVLVLCSVSVISSLVFCAVSAWILHVFRNRYVDGELDDLSARMGSIEMSLKGSVGRSNREAKAERQGEAITKAMMLFKDGKKPEEVLKEVGSAYPDVALDLISKKLLKGI